MSKEGRSAHELSGLLVERLGIEGLVILVLRDNVYGWNGFTTSVPDGVVDIHVKMQIAVEELRKLYVLSDSASGALYLAHQ